ncbi:MAG TPA: SIR2 family protein, partial [Calditrichia bacterium]|nr:SIR2 family protein [Calditrichia bacterium]
WLTSLFQSEHFALLAGSGLSHAIHDMATGKPLPGMATVSFSVFNDEINAKAKESAQKYGRSEGNIEDQIRIAIELLDGLNILGARDGKYADSANKLESELKNIMRNFADSILLGEQGIINAKEEKRQEAFNYLVSFLMSFASRTGTRDRLQIFTTNYDRFIEAGADAAGLSLIDRFIGSLNPLFRSSRLDIDIHYNPPGIRGEPRYLEGVAKFTKLHGSLDWLNSWGQIRKMGIPFGAKEVHPYLDVPGTNGEEALGLMIYPNDAKDRETSLFPYIELFRDFAASICRPNNVLITYGYSFGDEHINRIIEDMLIIPSTHLVIISHGDPLKRILNTYERLGRHSQITLLIGNILGDLTTLVDHFLPKPAIDRTTFKMAELLKARYGSSESPVKPEEQKSSNGDNNE